MFGVCGWRLYFCHRAPARTPHVVRLPIFEVAARVRLAPVFICARPLCILLYLLRRRRPFRASPKRPVRSGTCDSAPRRCDITANLDPLVVLATVGSLVAAFGFALQQRDFIRAVIAFASGSAVLAVVFALLGALFVAVLELVVGAGLVAAEGTLLADAVLQVRVAGQRGLVIRRASLALPENRPS